MERAILTNCGLALYATLRRTTITRAAGRIVNDPMLR
jgi:hypothetical protein